MIMKTMTISQEFLKMWQTYSVFGSETSCRRDTD
ncbi:MAG: hypothetical protein AW10_00125 [Candidatus Accumulibacter appositus]|uniref:Uncharacterized protein n=1 Tax=Candidatus Accumulibacter appositus TaxID=1454003 RepID=A0A011Q1M1_9PROT|nr:MAG: hypothetical protein AW10_00125 [Candidatus Accumulibacter appositus]